MTLTCGFKPAVHSTRQSQWGKRIGERTDMELAQSAYLYALAQIGATFAGFTALFMMLRQTVGGKASAMDFFVTQRFLMLSFLAVVGAMLPSLLAAFFFNMI
jgi:hypothetical protein